MTNIIFSHKNQLADNIWELHFTPIQKVRFTPGQYTNLCIKLPQKLESRVFTITSLPSDDAISFTVKFPIPCSAYKKTLFNLKPGDEVTVTEPKGDFVLPRDGSRSLVFVAGGLGIASFVSMLKASYDSHRASISLLYAHKPDERLYQDLIGPHPSINQSEFISPNKIIFRDILDRIREKSLIYISGSEDFTLQIRDGLNRLGINPTVIVYDYFTGYKPEDF